MIGAAAVIWGLFWLGVMIVMAALMPEPELPRFVLYTEEEEAMINGHS